MQSVPKHTIYLTQFLLTTILRSFVTPIILIKILKVGERKTLAQSSEWLNQGLNSTVALMTFNPKMHLV